ncbi:MAG: DUF4062 domain-containing protein [Clostridium sp.]|nr:DUF4062 domain-containing protein [Clostridium sp.]
MDDTNFIDELIQDMNNSKYDDQVKRDILMKESELIIRRKLQVFVSSTYSDLTLERQAAVEAILKSGNIPAGMELFKSSNRSQLKTIKEWIDESDVYMLILGGRYGTIESRSKLSYTQLEYNYAVKKKIPYFSIVVTKEALEKKVKEQGTGVMELANVDKYNKFRNQVLKNVSNFYSDTKDIQISILDTLHDFQRKYNFKGWIPGKFIEDYIKVKQENVRLKNQIYTYNLNK